MKRIALAVVAVLSASNVFADPQVGTYIGSLRAAASHGERTYGVTIEITSAENGKLKGAISYDALDRCPRSFLAEGTYEDNNVKLLAQSAQRVHGCGLPRFWGVAEGNKLIGKFPWAGAVLDISLSK